MSSTSAYQEFTGKSVEEALRLAREAFGVGLDDLDFEILSPGSRGVLGMGAEPARVTWNSQACCPSIMQLDSLTPTRLSAIGPGEAYVWSSKASDDAFSNGAVRIRCRPRVTQHGGGTKTALAENT